MVGPSHAVAALAATVALARLGGVCPDRLGLLCILVGAIFPDIDGEGSITRPGTLLRGVLPRFLVRMLDALGQLLNAMIKSVSRHRGFFHWPMLSLLLMLFGWWYGLGWVAWFGFGYLTHILADLLTCEGIAVFAPLSWKPFCLKLFRTSSVAELMVDIVLLGAVIYWGYGLLPESYLRGFEEIQDYYRRLKK